MPAYYNEFDPKAASWLRELIKQGHIAQGVVDERSIIEVRPSDLVGYDQCHFFAGIGVWSHALRQAGWEDSRKVWTGSCPCQPFSAAGKRGGVDDERHLWPEFFRLIAECRPVTVLGEQVASKDGLAWLDSVHSDLEGAGYTVGAVDSCAAGFGAPHIRQRLYFVAESCSAGAGDIGGPINEQGRYALERRGAGLRQGDGKIGTGRSNTGGATVLVADTERVGRRRGLHGPDPGAEGQPIPEDEVEGSGSVGLLADAVRGGTYNAPGDGVETKATPDGKDGSLPGERLRTRIESPTRLLADAESIRSGEGQSHGRRGGERSGEGEGAVVVRGEYVGVVEHSCLSGLEGFRRPGGEQVQAGRQGEERYDTEASAVGFLAHSDGRDSGTEREQRSGEYGQQPEDRGPCNGFWSNAEWLPCRDGKSRPVEPGPESMADGLADELGLVRLVSHPDRPYQERIIYSPLIQKGKARVMRLRGYGNAIVAPQATAFISAYMEVVS